MWVDRCAAAAWPTRAAARSSPRAQLPRQRLLRAHATRTPGRSCRPGSGTRSTKRLPADAGWPWPRARPLQRCPRPHQRVRSQTAESTPRWLRRSFGAVGALSRPGREQRTARPVARPALPSRAPRRRCGACPSVPALSGAAGQRRRPVRGGFRGVHLRSYQPARGWCCLAADRAPTGPWRGATPECARACLAASRDVLQERNRFSRRWRCRPTGGPAQADPTETRRSDPALELLGAAQPPPRLPRRQIEGSGTRGRCILALQRLGRSGARATGAWRRSGGTCRRPRWHRPWSSQSQEFGARPCWLGPSGASRRTWARGCRRRRALAPQQTPLSQTATERSLPRAAAGIGGTRAAMQGQTPRNVRGEGSGRGNGRSAAGPAGICQAGQVTDALPTACNRPSNAARKPATHGDLDRHCALLRARVPQRRHGHKHLAPAPGAGLGREPQARLGERDSVALQRQAGQAPWLARAGCPRQCSPQQATAAAAPALACRAE